jgi:hypothetical protein
MSDTQEDFQAPIQIAVSHLSNCAVRVYVTDDATGQLLVDPPTVLGPRQASIGTLRPGMSVTLGVAPLSEMTLPETESAGAGLTDPAGNQIKSGAGPKLEIV